MLNKLFEQFLQEQLYLKGVSRKTIDWYKYSFRAYCHHSDPDGVNRFTLNRFVVGMRQTKLSAVSANNYIRGMNVFLAWLFENEHTPEHLKIKRVKQEQTVIQTFNDKQLEAMINWKPQDYYELRLHTLLLTAIDTGCRIEELLTLTRENTDLDNLILKVTGKGDKQRLVPISIELRKVLYKFLKRHEFSLVFCTRDGHKVRYRNMLRDFKDLGEKLGFKGVRVSFHTLRHTFAVNFVRHGGNILYLQRMLGHTDISMTKRYVDLQTEDLKISHQKMSTLSRLR